MSFCLRVLKRKVTTEPVRFFFTYRLEIKGSTEVIKGAAGLHTSSTCWLRKAPAHRGVLGPLWTYLPWPSYFLKAFIRKKYKPEDFGPDEQYRRSMFHRLSYVYVVLAWTALGVGLIALYKESPADPEKHDNPLPHQSELDKGGALYWMNALKTPDEMMNKQGVTVLKFSGLRYEGKEDATVAVKQIAQEKSRRRQAEGHDFYLRKYNQIPMEKEGGPTNEQLRKQLADEGRDYDLELDFANSMYRVKTTYNPDGTVGDFIDT